MLSSTAMAYSKYLRSYSWQWFVSLTFKEPPSRDKARAMLNAWLNKQNRRQFGKRYCKRSERLFYMSIEDLQAREAIHYHLLITNLKHQKPEKQTQATQDWSQLCGGDAQVLLYRPDLGGVEYLCQKIDDLGTLPEFGGDTPKLRLQA
jgi:hypothetical protein